MENEKRLINANVVRQKINAFAASVVYRGSDLMITEKDSCNPYEYTRGYEQGVLDATNIVTGQPTVDAVEMVHGQWEKNEPDKHGNRKPRCSICCEYHLALWSDYTHCNYCPNSGAKMDK